MRNPEALAVLLSWEPSAPRLTWYGDDGERVELSGRTLANWVVKAGNLLAGEADVAGGDAVRLDLPPHWRLLVWSLGVWAVGAEPVLDGSAEDVVVTTEPDRWAGSGAQLVAVPLPALARSWPGTLPPGALDGAAELMGQPDVPLFAAASVRVAPRVGERRLLNAGGDPATLLERAWACWEQGGSVVLVTPRAAAEHDAIAAQEGAVVG